jgi:hypothetical protein
LPISPRQAYSWAHLPYQFTQSLKHLVENDMSDLLQLAQRALADLEGIMPEFEPSGDRQHPAWQTIRELQAELGSYSEIFEQEPNQ